MSAAADLAAATRRLGRVRRMALHERLCVRAGLVGDEVLKAWWVALVQLVAEIHEEEGEAVGSLLLEADAIWDRADAEALGAKFYDADGNEIPPGGAAA